MSPAAQRSRSSRDYPPRPPHPQGAASPRGDGYPRPQPDTRDYRSAPPRSRPGQRPPYESARPSRLEAGRTARARTQQRRRRAILLALLLVAGILVGVDMLRGSDHGPRNANANPNTKPSANGSAKPSASVTASPDDIPGETAPDYPETGPGTFTYSNAPSSPIFGTSGTLHRYRVAVENGTGSDAEAFALQSEQILASPNSWIAGKNVRLQRVPKGASYDFTLYLATPGTSEHMCAVGGLATEKFTSCRLPGQVIINLDRWWKGVDGYGAPLSVYREYAINHEVGHELGHGHEACPGAGKLAPVMQQQTYGLKGCIANPWPYIDGKRYAGAPIP